MNERGMEFWRMTMIWFKGSIPDIWRGPEHRTLGKVAMGLFRIAIWDIPPDGDDDEGDRATMNEPTTTKPRNQASSKHISPPAAKDQSKATHAAPKGNEPGKAVDKTTQQSEQLSKPVTETPGATQTMHQNPQNEPGGNGDIGVIVKSPLPQHSASSAKISSATGDGSSKWKLKIWNRRGKEGGLHETEKDRDIEKADVTNK